MDTNGVLAAVFDPSTNTLRTTPVESAPAAVDSSTDENGAWSQAFDPTNQALKVVIV